MKRKFKVAVLMGGSSSEREISLMSGNNVLKNLDPRKFIGFPIIIRKNSKPNWVTKLKNADIAFIAFHGPFGEDGTVQGLLEMLGIPYTGSGVLASAIGMDKLMFRKIMQQEGIPIPKYLALRLGESTKIVWQFFKNPPIFVKPNNQGSSIGASIVRKKKDLRKALDSAFRLNEIAMIDEYLVGTEVTCGVLGNNEPFTLPITEVISKKGFFDFESKYTEGLAQEITPARISRDLTCKVQELAIHVFQAIGARGFARIDFIIKENQPVVLEINTIPGLTPVSILPKQAQVTGISYTKLLSKIINFAL